MQDLLLNLSKLLTVSPGNLVVHLALAISIMATLQVVLIGRRSNSNVPSGRMILGLVMILVAQLILFASSGIAWQNLTNPLSFLPPLDRAVTTWSLVWIVWLWSFPRPSRPADVINILSNLIVLILFLFTLTAWTGLPTGTPFNSTWLDWGWGILAIFVILIGILFLLLERPQGWGMGLIILALNLTGYLVHLMWGETAGNFAAPVRLAQLCTYPLLPSLAQRLYAPQAQTADSSDSPITEKRRYTADPRAVYAWLQVATQNEPNKIYQALTHAIAQSMLADLCYLAYTPSTTADINIQCGYDQIRDEVLSGTILQQNEFPALASALQHGRPLRLGGSGQTPAELVTIANAFGLEKPGNLLVIPLVSGQANWGGLLLLSPYSERVWTASDQTYLLTATDTIVKILQKAEMPQESSSANKEAQAEIERLQTQIGKLQNDNKALAAMQASRPSSIQQHTDMESLMALQQESQIVIAKLQVENEKLRGDLTMQAASLKEGAPNHNYMEAELRMALEEMAHLQNALAGANMKILALEMQARHADGAAADGRELIVSILQELRQPLTSINGYTELLMSESVGILGALQRRLLERVRASIGRMSNLLDDMARLASQEGITEEVKTCPIDFNEIIDRAVGEATPRIQEKDIILSVDITENLPTISGDQDAIEQIVVQLLDNATTATPPSGQIDLIARIDDEQEQPYLLLKITDTGGGIAPEDLPRVFWRQYRNENPAVPGIGDKGVGLTIARTLAEAQGGRIWVDSIPGISTTFSVLLPIHSAVANTMSETNESPA